MAEADLVENVNACSQNGFGQLESLFGAEGDRTQMELSAPFPLPVCTSTPVVERRQSKLINTMVCLPTLQDSGLGDSLTGSSLCSISSPSVTHSHSFISQLISPSTDGESPFIPDIEDCGTFAPSSIVPSERPEEQISSTPICPAPISVLERKLTFSSIEKLGTSPDFSEGLLKSPFQPDFNIHRGSQNASTVAAGELEASKVALCRNNSSSITETEMLHFKQSREEKCDSVQMGRELVLSGEFVERFEAGMRQLLPGVGGQVIGRNVGVEQVDLVGELDRRKLPAGGVIAWLQPYLSPQDFIRMSGVCRHWRRVCLRDKVISSYRALCAQTYQAADNQENRGKACGGKQRGDNTGLTRSGLCLRELQLAVPTSAKQVLSPPCLFLQTRQALRWEETLRHCPLCLSVATISAGQDRGNCQNHACLHQFCLQCHAPYHLPQPCKLPAGRPRHHQAAGGRKSKKNLKRISNL